MTSMEEALGQDGYLIVSSPRLYEVGHILEDVYDQQVGNIVPQPFAVVGVVSFEETREYCVRHGWPSELSSRHHFYKVVTD